MSLFFVLITLGGEMKKQVLAGFIPGRKSQKKQYTILAVKQAGLTLPFKINSSLKKAVEAGVLNEVR